MRNLLTLLVYTFVILLIGRNFLFLPRFSLFSTEKAYPSELKQQTQTIIAKQPGNYGVYFLNLSNGQNFGLNEDMTFTAASVNKVPIVAALYYLNHQGKVDLDEKITIQSDDIQDYGSGTLRYQTAGTVYSLRSLAKLSLQQSDNTAAHVIAKRIGTDVIQHLVDTWGLTQTSIDDNKTSAKDMGLLFQKIYRGQIASASLTKELLGFMRDTDSEDRLPALLPSDAIVYHKTGDAVGSLHDVGIIKRGNLVFYIGVLTSDIGNYEDQTKQTEAKIAKNILDFYAKRQ